jgi:hypothetical protein
MDLLKQLTAALLALLPACYEPQWQDCAVRCSSSDDCAPGQSCGAQGYCAAAGLTCAPATGDGAPMDAPTPPGDGRKDDKPKVQLRVKLSEGGRILVDGVGACDNDHSRNGDCQFSVTYGQPQAVRAIPHGGYRFTRWMSPTCATAGAICVVVPLDSLTEVRVRFDRDEPAVPTE